MAHLGMFHLELSINYSYDLYLSVHFIQKTLQHFLYMDRSITLSCCLKATLFSAQNHTRRAGHFQTAPPYSKDEPCDHALQKL